MKKITTVEEYNDPGKLIKKTVTEEEGEPEVIRQYIPISLPKTTPDWPQWPYSPIYGPTITCEL